MPPPKSLTAKILQEISAVLFAYSRELDNKNFGGDPKRLLPLRVVMVFYEGAASYL